MRFPRVSAALTITSTRDQSVDSTARAQGRTVSVTNFADRAALEDSRDKARSMRERFAEAAGAAIVEVAEMDVVVAHLGVPQTA